MQYEENIPFGKILSIQSTILSLIRLLGKAIYNVEKSYADRLDTRKPLDFNLFNTAHEFLIHQKSFHGPVIDIFTAFDNMIFDSSKTRG